MDIDKLASYIAIDGIRPKLMTPISKGISKIHTFKLNGTLPSCNNHDFKAFLYFKGVPITYNQIGSCSISVSASKAGKSLGGKCEVNIFAPNVISPNDDGNNDTFHPNFSTGVIYWAHLLVFDRWGDLLFDDEIEANTGEYLTGNESQLTWDGFYKNKVVQNGVYTIILEYKYCGNQKKEGCDLTNFAKKFLKDTNNPVICGDVTKVD
jgi:hypothetical protein